MVVLMGHSIRLLALAIVIAVVVAEGAGRAQDARVIDIAAERFAFTPSEIRVKAGTRLEIRLQSDDTAHGFHIVGTDVDIELPKRGRGVAGERQISSDVHTGVVQTMGGGGSASVAVLRRQEG